ncbi:MAG: hypothetical protein KJZ84_01220 [Bryobacteraceae bacterium]|nr:hypothetical protein [Bryobacteraceae bacterium]
MARIPQQERERVHALVDQLAPRQLEAIRNLLEAMTPGREEDEEISAAEEAAVARSKEWFRENEGVPFDEVVADLGLSMEQIRAAAKYPAT